MVRSQLSAVLGIWRPFCWEERDSENRPVYQGTTISPFLNITNSLNITVDISIHTGPWGFRLSNGSYTGMLRLVMDDKVDVAVGPFYQSAAVALELPEGEPHLSTEFVFLSGYRHLFITKLAQVPFDGPVSLVIVMLCLLMAIMFFITQWNTAGRMTLWDALCLSQSIFLQDPIDNTPFVSASSRISLATWSFGTFIIAQIVAGILRSMTAVKTPVHLLDYFQEILDNPSLRPMVLRTVGAIEYLKALRGEQMYKIEERIDRMNGKVEHSDLLKDNIIKPILNGKAVFIMDMFSMLGSFPAVCDSHSGMFHISEGDRSMNNGVWYYSPRLDLATRKAIDQRLRWLFQAGARWVRDQDLYPAPPKCFTFAVRSNQMGESETFSLDTLFPFILVWITGCAASIVAFLMEMISVSLNSKLHKTRD